MAESRAKARLEAVEEVFGALAHPARRNILLALHFRGGSMTAGDIAQRFAVSWPTTTRHLQVLEKAGLVTHRKKGRSRVYRLESGRLGVVEEWIAWFATRPAGEGPAEPQTGTGRRTPNPRKGRKS